MTPFVFASVTSLDPQGAKGDSKIQMICLADTKMRAIRT